MQKQSGKAELQAIPSWFTASISWWRNLAATESGGLSLEWILLSTVVVLSGIAAIGTVRDSLVNEFGDISIAVTSVNQSFVVGGRRPATFVDSSKNAAQ